MSNPAFQFDHVHIISETPRASAEWYQEMFGATIAADTVARGAPQIFVALGGTTILIRGRRPGEEPAAARPIQPYADYSSHNAWGTDHFGFLYEGDLAAFCDTLRAKGVTFPVELKKGLGGSLLCYMKLPNPAVAIASIRKSRDIAWLRGFRANMAAVDAPEIVAAIDERLAELDETALRVAIGRPLANRFLIQRVQEAVRVYETFLAYKHGGKRIAAARTRSMIKRWGEKEAVWRTVTNRNMSTRLDLLAKYGRVDCAYEQIILDFPDEFDPVLTAKAKANLARLPPQPSGNRDSAG